MRPNLKSLLVGGVAVAILGLPHPSDAAYPNDILVGHWTLVGEKPNSATPQTHCTITEIVFGPEIQIWMDKGQKYQTRVLGYSIEGDEVHVTTGRIDAYKIIDKDNIAYEGVFAQCAYARLRN